MRGRLLLLAVAALLAAPIAGPAHAAAPDTLRADDGWLEDAQGRVVLLRGTNLDVGLRRPSPAGDLPTEALEDHARTMKRLGFNVVRLQLTWGAIEPGTAGPNDPSICSPGPPGDPGQWHEAHAQRYLDRVERVVDVLRRHGISTLFQIAQYAYNERFGGPPSHPDWAVCTDGVPITRGVGPGAYTQPGVSIAAEHFWHNDVQGNLQGEYQRMLAALASRFAGKLGVAGYELYNEPFSGLGMVPDGRFDGLVQCFYMGSAEPGRLADGSRPSCPPGVPAEGAIPRMRAIDPDHALHPQPHIYTNFGVETRMGPLPARNLVFNFHVYCPSGLGLQVPDELRGPECEATERRAVEESERTRHAMASAEEPGVLPGFMSEFGFGDNEAMLRHMTTLADRHLLGWAYFTWRNPDGPDNEGILRNADGSLRPKARLLARPYPMALAGMPTAMGYDPDARRFELRYEPRRDTRGASTVIALPEIAYGRDGACPRAEGAAWRLAEDRLLVSADPRSTEVRVTVVPGRCGARADARRVCVAGRGRARGWRLGPARVGRSRGRQRRVVRATRLRAPAAVDRHCVRGGGRFEVRYPTRRLLRSLGRRERRRVRGRAVMLFTSSRRFSVAGVRPGMSARAARRRLRSYRSIRRRRAGWRAARGPVVRRFVQVRRGRVVAVAIADRRLTRTRAARRRLLASWDQPVRGDGA